MIYMYSYKSMLLIKLLLLRLSYSYEETDIFAGLLFLLKIHETDLFLVSEVS